MEGFLASVAGRKRQRRRHAPEQEQAEFRGRAGAPREGKASSAPPSIASLLAGLL
jgi:hypothetical protein